MNSDNNLWYTITIPKPVGKLSGRQTDGYKHTHTHTHTNLTIRNSRLRGAFRFADSDPFQVIMMACIILNSKYNNRLNKNINISF